MNFTSANLLFTLNVFLFFCGCSNNTVNQNEAVNKVIDKLIEADNKSDIQSVINSYTDSVEFYPTGKEFTKGINNVKAGYEKLFKDYRLSLTTQITETIVFGNAAMVTGINKGTKTSNADSSIVKLEDKYIAILLRNKPGEWKIDKLIWSINH